MTAGVLYLGDTALDAAAAYLAGLIDHAGWTFDYLPTFTEVPADLVTPRRDLFILSDFTADCFPQPLQETMLEHVHRGAGLIMLGGWESFTGAAGGWHDTPVAAALPVHIDPHDDRVNCDQPALIRAAGEHPITADLPWDDRPPIIGGFNRWAGVKDDAQVLLHVERYAAERAGDTMTMEHIEQAPLLAVGSHGAGRVACLATDVAPHWVGPMVDWGTQRVTAQAPGAGDVEVGDLYAKFFTQLLGWTGKLDVV